MAIKTKNEEEQQYLNLIRDILDKGQVRGDRTGTGTLSLFAPPQLRFSLRQGRFPLLTTKKVFTKAIFYELLWFVSGCTDGNKLKNLGVKIWEGNGSRAYLDSLGLTTRAEGDLGPVYGFQWRHFGAKYGTCHDDYSGQGVDQLAEVIHTIKTNPSDRRIILSAWNPAAMKEMALPPCHMFAQFYVSNLDGPVEDRELSCVMYQRSADMGLGVPFNIASYALLTRLIAHVCGIKAGDFIHTLGDAHVYLNHVAALETQLTREPYDFPKLEIREGAGMVNGAKSIDGFKYEDLKIVGYQSHESVKMVMSV